MTQSSPTSQDQWYFDKFSGVSWKKFDAVIKDSKGNEVFRQDGVHFPKTWSQTAVNIVASKYFYGDQESPKREKSLDELVERVVKYISDEGHNRGYFGSKKEYIQKVVFSKKLRLLLYNQYVSFNSPVWFNVGIDCNDHGPKSSDGYYFCDNEKIAKKCETYRPQSSACFIQSVKDNMSSIMGLATSEAMLFKSGSGTGTDLSTIRSRREKLTGGGRPSGPLSFMKVYDSIAGVVKSGGKTRRAAKMQTLNVTHPDIMEFIECKKIEEDKAKALIAQGYDPDFNGEAYSSVYFQNANISIRADDNFFQAVEKDEAIETKSITTGKTVEKIPARKILRKLSEITWDCGDPGIQYSSTINKWHTCKNSGNINSSNPCAEYLFLDDSACNLASINLMKFRNEDGTIDVELLEEAAKVLIVAQEILVDSSSYPTEQICVNSHNFRPLGLGFANLGSYLMSVGIPYDSDKGRYIAGLIASIIHFAALKSSIEIASVLKSPFPRYQENAESMESVMSLHFKSFNDILGKSKEYFESKDQRTKRIYSSISEKALELKDSVTSEVFKSDFIGFRNAQVTVVAPTGTIGLMMDCDTTGIEPELSLVKYKLLAGGGSIKFVNTSIEHGLRFLGYSTEDLEAISKKILEGLSSEDIDLIKKEHKDIFKCSFPTRKNGAHISFSGHIKMMAAIQPFLSGGISKTCNMPENCTVEEVEQAYIEGWKLGLKALAIYRDGSKGSQPLTVNNDSKNDSSLKPGRRRLPSTRDSVTHSFSVGNQKGYITVGKYEDGYPGEIFVKASKQGSTFSGLIDAIASIVSVSLQHGVPLSEITSKMTNSRFEPLGLTGSKEIPIATSFIDYIGKWLEINFLGRKKNETQNQENKKTSSGLTCLECGNLLTKTGTCWTCPSCGSNTGCG